jgi:hypothetical protein
MCKAVTSCIALCGNIIILPVVFNPVCKTYIPSIILIRDSYENEYPMNMYNACITN